MRWLLATPEFPPDTGGVARYLGVLAEGSGDWLSVASPHGPIRTEWEWKMPPRWLPSTWRTLRLLRGKDRTGLLVSHVLPFGYAALVAYMAGYEYAVVCHGLDVAGPLSNGWKRFWVGTILRQAKVVVANSDATRGIILRHGVDARRVAVVHPPLSWEASSAAAAAETDFAARHGLAGKRILLVAGRVVARKGIGVAIEALERLSRRYPDCLLVVAGGGPERFALREKAKSAGLEYRIVFTGRVSEEEMRDAYRAAEVVLYPSVELPGDIEGFGIAAADAGLFGKPVVASRTGGLPEAVRDGETGILVEPGDPEALAEAIGALFEDGERAAALGEGGRRLAASRTHESFRTVFRSALDTKR